MKSPLSYLLGLSLLVSASSASTVISWNYNRYGDAYSSRATDTAGLVSASYWNDSWLDNTTTDLMDSTGSASTLDITLTSFNNWSIQASHPGTDSDGSFNKEILNGYLNAGNAAWGPNPTYSSVDLAQIPFAQYSIIVYFSSDVAGREGDVTVNGTTYSFNTVGPDSVSGLNALLQGTTDTSGSYQTAANYAMFTGLTGVSQTIKVQMRDNDEWGGIAAFQVVETSAVPEPSSYASLLGAVCGLFVVTRRRRRRA